MAKPELLQSLTRLNKSVDNLLVERNQLKERLRIIEEENQELIKQHENDMIMLEKTTKELEFLKFSHRLAATPEALVATRNKISQMLRTIDSCILMINDD